jgi:very-short-patch-repair endonuclease
MGQGRPPGGFDGRPWRWERMGAEERLRASMELCESPIEARLLPFLSARWPPIVRLEDLGARATGVIVQLWIGRFRVDFAVARRPSTPGIIRAGPGPLGMPGGSGRGQVRLVVVECDGRKFHDKARDAARDRELGADERVIKIVRLPGTLIQVDPREAAGLVFDAAEAAFAAIETPGITQPAPGLDPGGRPVAMPGGEDRPWTSG